MAAEESDRLTRARKEVSRELRSMQRVSGLVANLPPDTPQRRRQRLTTDLVQQTQQWRVAVLAFTHAGGDPSTL